VVGFGRDQYRARIHGCAMSRFAADPFGESVPLPFQRTLCVLGAVVRFESNSRKLLALASEAFSGLPAHRWPAREPLRVCLRLADAEAKGRIMPPPPRLTSGGGLLHATLDSDNFAVVSPEARSALVVASPAMLKHSHLLRYELIEFATLTLAARTQRLVPLHAACIGRAGRGVLVLGDSGDGKSTLGLLSALSGLELLAEDSAFVKVRGLLATGAPNYLHVRSSALRLVASAADRGAIRRSRVIRRRSGIRKFAFDLRRAGVALARRPLRLVGVVLLTGEPAGSGPLLAPVQAVRMRRELRRLQPYARGRPEWSDFERRIAALPAYALARAKRPVDGVDALRRLLRARRR
jgi:hypothetical protein